MRSRTTLQPNLHDTVVLARCGQHRLTLADIYTDRLLAIDVGTGLTGRDHWQGVPVVGGCHKDEIQFLLSQHFAVVGVGARGLAGFLAGSRHFSCRLERLAVDIAQPDYLDGLDLDQAE